MRLTQLREKVADAQLDAILITTPANRRYLSGFSGSAGTLIVSQDRALLATDFRYFEQVQRQAPDFELVKVTDQLTDLLPDLVAQIGVQRLGIESDDVTVALYQRLRDALPESVELVSTSGLVEELRAVKDDQELVKLQQAIDLTDAAYAHIADFMQPGLTERQVAWELERFMRTNGAEGVAFDIIVAAGPNGAMPHARPSTRPIQAGDPVVMDMGALVEGYHSDLTRTVALGEASDHYREVYDLVLRAQEAVLDGVRPGMTGQAADALARDIIEAAGHGEHFGHGLGHGFGLVIHEGPSLSHRQRGANVLRPGMVFTIEPGVYLPGEFGVRIEDVAVLREDGLQVLSRAAKAPVLHRP